MQKIVINSCLGGFSLSREGVMAYAKRKGIKLYPFVNKIDPNGHIDFHNFEPYDGQHDIVCIHYHTKPLKDGKYIEKTYFNPRMDIKRDDPILLP